MNTKRRGFTLTELLITIALAGLFITFAIPGFYAIIQNNKSVTMVNTLSSGLNYARMESIRRGVRVSVCSAGNASLSTCGTNSQWAQGWIVFVDADNNNAVDSSNNLLKVNEALPTGTTVTANNALVSFDGSGFVTNGNFTMTVTAAGCTGYNARVLTLSTSGRLSIVRSSCP